MLGKIEYKNFNRAVKLSNLGFAVDNEFYEHFKNIKDKIEYKTTGLEYKKKGEVYKYKFYQAFYESEVLFTFIKYENSENKVELRYSAYLCIMYNKYYKKVYSGYNDREKFLNMRHKFLNQYINEFL